MIIQNIRGLKPSTKTINQRKKIKEFDFCCDCGKEFYKHELEIEHKIPLCIGGDIDEIQIMCKKCHKYKTKMDLIYLSFLKKLGILIKIGPYEYEIINEYKCLEGYKLMYRTSRTRITSGFS
jgi:hypothetical protein